MAKEDVIYLSNVRLSFPNLVEPQRKKNDAGQERISYNCEFIMPQEHLGFQQFMKAVAAKAAENWKEHAGNVLAMVNADRKKRCYGGGAEKVNGKTFLPYHGYVGNVWITAGRDKPPQIIQADGIAVDPDNTLAYKDITRKMYGGCRVNAAVKPWMQDNQYGRGVRCDLVAVQFAGDDEPFGEGEVDASDLFGAATPPTTALPTPAGMPWMTPQAPAAPAMPAPPFGGAPGLPSFLT